ncbi:MAG TPA: ATP-binding protein [Gemmatimonadaceae bacterium]|nr:ATP-binding protein [Gemmatimonadaceae bacterium]
MRFPRLGIRARLTLLTLALLTPMVAIAAWHFSEQRADSQTHIEERSAEVARLIASRADEFVRRTEVTLEAAALLTRVDPPDSHFNDSVLTLLEKRAVNGIGTLNVQLVDGPNIGSSNPVLAARRSFSVLGRRYYTEALRTGKFAVGEPVRGQLDSTRWMVGYGLPIRGRSGKFVAVAYASYWLDSLRYVGDAGTLPQGSVVTVVDDRGRIVFRSVDPGKFAGLDVSKRAGFDEMLAKPRGVMTGVSALDSIDRVRAWEHVERAPWFVVVGIATSEAALQQSARSRDELLIIVLTVALALLIAALVAGRISSPVIALTADAQAIAGGDLARRGEVTSTSEVGTLATAFNQMAETVEKQTKALTENERRYRLVFEGNPLPMWVWEVSTRRFLAVNDAAVARFGYSHDEFLSMTARDVRPPGDVQHFEDLVSGPLARRNETGIWTYRVKSGDTFEAEIYASPISWGGRDSYLVVIHDISERFRAEAALASSQAQLRQMQKIEAVGSLAAGIAHDFNNLLTAIIGSMDLAIASLPEEHEATDELRHARGSAMRATDLTKRLLTFSRQKVSAPLLVDVRDIVRGMQPLLVRTLGEQVKLDLRLDRSPATVRADPSQLEQVVLNLLVNARDAMPNGGSAVIHVHLVAPESAPAGLAAQRWVLLAVTDNGMGMDATTADRAFEPFFTTKERGKGTGLGLPMVFSIVQAAGGQVRLQSKVDEGTTLRVYLPFCEGEPAPRATPQRGTEAVGGGESILLVEDDDAVRRVTSRMLEGLGFRVIAAAGPRQALDLARDHIGAIDVLLSDVIMPGINGREMAEAVRKLRPAMKVVFVSGYTDDVALLQQLRAQTLFFLQKPFTAQALGQMVRSALDAPLDDN